MNEDRIIERTVRVRISKDIPRTVMVYPIIDDEITTLRFLLREMIWATLGALIAGIGSGVIGSFVWSIPGEPLRGKVILTVMPALMLGMPMFILWVMTWRRARGVLQRIIRHSYPISVLDQAQQLVDGDHDHD